MNENEVLKRSFLLTVMVVFLFHVSIIMPLISYGKPTQNSQIIISTKLENVTQDDIERVKKEAEIALDSIPALLGIERYKRDIKIKIMKKGPCRTTRDKIVLLGVWFVQNKRAPIVHEVAHVIADKHKWNKFFNEGLAEFLQDRFGEDAGGITYYNEPQHLSLDDLVTKYKDSLISLYYLKHNNGVFRLRNKSANRKIAYIEAASFIKFLYEKYGEHKLRDIYHSRNLDYEKVYGKSIQELESDWLNYVFIEQQALSPNETVK